MSRQHSRRLHFISSPLLLIATRYRTRRSSFILIAALILTSFSMTALWRLATPVYAQSLPAPWVDADIGTTNLTGTATYSAPTFTVKGAGSDIAGTIDSFNYVYQPLSGDGKIVAKVLTVGNTHASAKAGVMIRETLVADSPFAAMMVTPTSGTTFIRRTTTATNTSATSGIALTAPYWVMVLRKGTDLAGYTSLNGTDWTFVGSATITMATNVYVGLAVTSRVTTSLNTSTFNSVTVTAGAPNNPPQTLITAPVTGTTYTAPGSVTINATATDRDTGGTISKVEFYDGATKIGEDLTSPYSFSWASVAAGSHIITTKAIDDTTAITTSAPVTITVQPTGVTTLNLTADAHVKDGTNAAINYGTLNPLEVGASATAGSSRDAYLKYDLTSVGASIASAKVRFYSAMSAAGSYSVSVYPVSDTTWTETGIVWNTKPALGTLISSFTINGTVFAWYEVDVTAYAQSEKTAGRNIISLGLHGTTTSTAYVKINSRQASAGGGLPELVITPGGGTNAAPTATLANPTGPFTATASIALSATATDSDGTIAKVEFFEGSNKIGEDTTSPYTLTWSNVAAGTYSLSSRSIDNLGAATLSTPVSVTVNQPNIAPTASMTAPVNGTVYQAPVASITLSASATDSDGTISKVEFYRGGTTLIGTVTASPFNFAWANPAVGVHSITAKSYDNSGAVTVSPAISITVNNQPTISISSPLNNASITPPATIPITVNVSDTDGTIAKVEYFQGATKIGENLTTPFNFTWMGAVENTAYSLTAKATDNLGGTKISTAVAIKYNTPPTVSLTAPASGGAAASPANIILSATAADVGGGTISKVEFYRGGTTLIGSPDTTSPYSVTWSNAPVGTYSFTAKAYDNQGAITTSSAISYTVTNAPTVSITSPTAGTQFAPPASITINATAADADGTVSKVEFFQGATKLGESLASPYSYTWTGVANGTYSLTAKATDNLGITTTSSAVSVTVNDPPVVALTGPADGTVYLSPGSIPLTATATDSNGTISKVEFYQGAVLLNSDTTAPYAFTWAGVASGTYTLTAKAYDNQSGTTTSTPVTVIVNNAPTISLTSPAGGASFPNPSNVTLTVNAADSDGTIAKVEYFRDTVKLGESTVSPFSFTLANLTTGSYNISAKATDNRGASAQTPETTFSVTRAPLWTQSPGPLGGVVAGIISTGTSLVTAVNSGIYRSTDGGVSWTRTYPQAGYSILLSGGALYVGSDGRIYKSIDDGVTWANLSNNTPQDGIKALAMSGTVLLAGTQNNSVFRSTDGGVTWAQASVVTPDGHIRALGVSGTKVVASTFSGAYISSDAGQTWAASGMQGVEGYAVLPVGSNLFYSTYGSGVYKSTDNGVTWNPVNNGLTNQYVSALCYDGTYLYSNSGFRSSDLGANWVPYNLIPSEVIVDTLMSTGTTLWAGSNGDGLYRSTDGGQSWTQMNAGIIGTDVWDMALQGSYLFAGARGAGVWRSSDNATTWAKTSNGLKTLQIQGLAVENATTLYAGIYGALLSRSIDSGANWTQWSSTQLPWTGNGTMAIKGTTYFSPANGQGVMRSTDNGQTWVGVNNGLTNFTFSNLIVAGPRVFAGTAGGVFVTTDNGTTWAVTNTGLANLNIHWLAANSTTIFAAHDTGCSVSRDNGATWTDANNGLTNASIIKLKVEGETAYAATSNGMYVSTDSGQSWTALDNAGLPETFMKAAEASATTLFGGTRWWGVWKRPNIFPTAQLQYPVSGANYASPAGFTIYAKAAEASGSVAKVDFFQDGNYIGTSFAGPYKLQVSGLPAGTYIFSAIATDSGGSIVMSNWSTVTVASPGANAFPNVVITSPVDNTIFPEGSDIPVTVNATDSNGSVVKVEYFSDGLKIGESTTAPFNFTWRSAPAGDHILSARATDNAGATTDSLPVFMSVQKRTGPAPNTGVVVKEYIYVGGRLLATEEGYGAGSNASLLISQTVPQTITRGQTASVSVVLKNIGSTTWTPAANYKLGSQNNQDNTNWGLNRVALPSSVAPGQTVTFTFTITAPATPGTYNWQWQMVQDAAGGPWFGEKTFNVAVTVN